MNRSIFKILGTLIALMLTLHNYAQIGTDDETLKIQAMDFVQSGQYYKAAQIYQSILEDDSSNIAIAYKYAEANRFLLNYTQAALWYKKVILSKDSSSYPDSWFYLGQAQKNIGEYQLAIVSFNNYLSIGKSEKLITHAQNEIASCHYAFEHINDSTTIEILHLPPPINTEFSEFNPIPFSGSDLVFSRYQNVLKDSFESIFSQSYVSDIMVSNISEQGYSTPSNFSKRLQGKSDFSANISFNHNQRKAYLTKCQDNNGLVGNCAIYFSQYQGGKWKKPIKLDKDINVEGYTSTQPFLVETKEYDVLYFASNKPGGYGKMDLYYIIIKDGMYQNVTNLGSIINTNGSEITPTYDTKTNTLYFSSDWHKGFGGFDIFNSIGGLNSWIMPENLGVPINSSGNDLHYISVSKNNEAWFSSNREDSYHKVGAENCCNDIYYASFEVIVSDIDSTFAEVEVIDSIEEKIQKLLPLTLYFHNDIPDPKSVKQTTDKNYEILLNDYFKLKDKYKREYSKGLTNDKKDQAKKDIELFFDDYVNQGFDDLEKLTELLKGELEKGKNIRLKIRGYASPLNTSEYNLNLSKRRIASLVNYLKAFDDGLFLPYFEHKSENGGSIDIYEDPLGDSQAANFVSDNPNDKRNSIYSRSAALERKIQIILYSSGSSINSDITNQEFPILSLKSSEIKKDTLKQGERKIVQIEFSNTGKSELVINSVSTNQLFSDAQLKKASYQPGENGLLYLLIQTENLEPGDYKVEIKINSNMLESSLKLDYFFGITVE